MRTDSAETDAGARDAVSEETTCGEVVGVLGSGGGGGGGASSSLLFSGFEERFNSVNEENDDSV